MAPERPGPDDHGVALARCGPLLTPLHKIKEEEIPNNIGSTRVNGEDDDLTSLTWLVQDKNLLKGINLKSGTQTSQTSPTSDFTEDGSVGSERSDSSRGSMGSNGMPINGTSTSAQSGFQNGKAKQSQFTHYDPMVHVKAKPPYSFSCLIFMAIEDSAARALPVKEIYAWIQNHFPFYRDAPAGWKNSVRHNLSLNKCFSKVEKAPNLGKGSLWMVDPAFRPNLLQSMSKAPLTSFNFLERQNNNSSSSDLKANGLSSAPLSGSSDNGIPTARWPPNRTSRLPNPDLFPFLSQRLAASGVELPSSENIRGIVKSEESYIESEDELEDVDAATAILTLKHGPRVIIPSAEDVYRQKLSQGIPIGSEGRPNSKVGRSGRLKKRANIPVITSSPSEDHTYSAGPNASSPDEAYGENSDTDDSRSEAYEGRMDEDEEQRRIAEGAADALLNLAGIASRMKREADDVPPPPTSKRVRRQRRLSVGTDTPRQRHFNHRVGDKNTQTLSRPSVTHADIMADLEVIRNNNNNEINKNDWDDVESGLPIKPRDKSGVPGSRIKVKYPNMPAPFVDNRIAVAAAPSTPIRSSVIKRVGTTGRKRKQWLEPGSKKSRR